MRDSAGLLALREWPRPLDDHLLGTRDQHRCGEIAHQSYLDLRPQLHDRERRVKIHVKGVVPVVIEGFQIGEAPEIVRTWIWLADAAMFPGGAAVRQIIQLVEQRGFVPSRTRLTRQERSMPVDDRLPPLIHVLRPLMREVPGVEAVAPMKGGVALVPALAGRAEGHHGRVPSVYERDRERLAG